MMELARTDKSDKNLVSVIVPVYNCEDKLRRCIGSVINQTYKNLEIILVDDGSTDRSGGICEEYALSDNRINVTHTSNDGPAAARNVGLRKSEGDFIFFLDADDYIESNALNVLVESYGRHRADIIVGDFNKITQGRPDSEHKGIFPGSRLLKKQDIIDYARCYLKQPNRFPLFAYAWGRLFKSSIIRRNNVLFDATIHTFEDVAFNFDYLKHADEVQFIKETIYNHLIYDNYASATMKIADNPQRMLGYRQALSSISSFLGLSCSCADIRKEAGHAYVFLTIIQLVRICGQISSRNRVKVCDFIRGVIDDPGLRNNLQCYSPSRGDSKILPILMKLKLVWLIILVCRYKAYRRYKKRGGVR